MARLKFESLRFREEKDKVEIVFMRLFHFYMHKADLANIREFRVGENFIDFDEHETRARRKFNQLLQKGFENLKTIKTGKKAVYIHKNSGIPLIGSNSFGLVDRNTNIIELKPLTGCNLECIYCSVDESKRDTDFVVEKDYLVEEFRKLARFKGINNIEAHIGGQAEPVLYSEIIELVRDLAGIDGVKVISIDTNGTLLNEKIVDELIKAGLTRFNLSINSLEEKKGIELAGAGFYSAGKIKKLIEYISGKCDLILAPVWVPGINDKDIGDIIIFSKKLKNTRLGIQNFLEYKGGKKPVKQESYEVFYKMLGELEKKHGVKLILKEEDFNIVPTKSLPKPFKKGDIIKAEIKCKGRFWNEYIGVSKDRVVTAISPKELKGAVKTKITRDKHNIFYGEIG